MSFRIFIIYRATAMRIRNPTNVVMQAHEQPPTHHKTHHSGEPDSVPELPQFARVCHSRGILNTLAKTGPIKYTDTDKYMHAYTHTTSRYSFVLIMSENCIAAL